MPSVGTGGQPVSPRLALGLAVCASACAAWVGSSVVYTFDVSDGLVLSLVGLGGLTWAAVLAATRSDAPGWDANGPAVPLGAWLVVAALLVRAPWIPSAPIFSDDVYRYVWEGRAWAAGFNPFAHAPIDPLLASLRDEGWKRVNHPEVSSIYPPLAQLLFVLLAPGGALAWKVLGALADVGTALVLARRSSRAAWLWALLPLTALESAGSGHLESVGVFLLVASLAANEAGRTGVAIAAAWAGAMVKLLPGAALLPLVRGVKVRAAVVVATVVAFAPILAAGRGAFRGFETYRAVWAFNGSAYPLLAAVLGSSAVAADPARTVLQGVGALVVVGAAWRSRRQRDAAATVAMAAAGAFVLLSPTVHPWYVLWPLGVALWVDGPAAVWTLAAVLVPFAYRVLGTLHAGTWHEDPVTRWVVWTPVWALGAYVLVQRAALGSRRRPA